MGNEGKIRVGIVPHEGADNAGPAGDQSPRQGAGRITKSLDGVQHAPGSFGVYWMFTLVYDPGYGGNGDTGQLGYVLGRDALGQDFTPCAK